MKGKDFRNSHCGQWERKLVRDGSKEEQRVEGPSALLVRNAKRYIPHLLTQRPSTPSTKV